LHEASTADAGWPARGFRSLNRMSGAVVAEQALVEHALRHTLVADALALQVPAPSVQSYETIMAAPTSLAYWAFMTPSSLLLSSAHVNTPSSLAAP
jgi:hypothetical protein